MLIHKWLTTFGKYLILMGRAFSRPERMRMFLKQYVKEMSQLGIDSIVSTVPNRISPASARSRAPGTLSKIHLIFVAEK